MKFTAIFAVLAATFVAAQEDTSIDGTTTQTSTTTMTMTVTHCSSGVSDCPYTTIPETTVPYSAHNTTSIFPTGSFTNTTSSLPIVTATATSIVTEEPVVTASTVPESGAATLLNPCILLGVIAAGTVLL